LKSAFSTLTNVNFDEERIAEVSSCVSITELMLLF
jgi:hydroxylamine reductase (hybrid-cluster protein)